MLERDVSLPSEPLEEARTGPSIHATRDARLRWLSRGTVTERISRTAKDFNCIILTLEAPRAHRFNSLPIISRRGIITARTQGVYVEQPKLVLFLDETSHSNPIDKIFAGMQPVPIT